MKVFLITNRNFFNYELFVYKGQIMGQSHKTSKQEDCKKDHPFYMTLMHMGFNSTFLY